LDQAGSDKVLDASISSTFCYVQLECLLLAWNKGSRKLGFSGGYNVYASFVSSHRPQKKLTLYRPMKSNPFNFWGKVIDCGDIPVTS